MALHLVVCSIDDVNMLRSNDIIKRMDGWVITEPANDTHSNLADYQMRIIYENGIGSAKNQVNEPHCVPIELVELDSMHVEVRGVITNKPPTGAYRGAGGPEAAFCLERTIDLVATDLGLDPAAVRR